MSLCVSATCKLLLCAKMERLMAVEVAFARRKCQNAGYSEWEINGLDSPRNQLVVSCHNDYKYSLLCWFFAASVRLHAVSGSRDNLHFLHVMLNVTVPARGQTNEFQELHAPWKREFGKKVFMDSHCMWTQSNVQITSCPASAHIAKCIYETMNAQCIFFFFFFATKWICQFVMLARSPPPHSPSLSLFYFYTVTERQCPSKPKLEKKGALW